VRLEAEAAITSTVGKCLDAAMVRPPVAIEEDLFDALGDGALCQPLANHTCRIAVLGRLVLRFLLERRSRHENRALAVVDHLPIDVVVRPEDTQPWPSSLSASNAGEVLGVLHRDGTGAARMRRRRHQHERVRARRQQQQQRSEELGEASPAANSADKSTPMALARILIV